MKQIKVSVIVPVYNVEEYLAECLESLESQSLKEIEVIIVNDGSTDESGKIAQNYSDKNRNFKLIERENGGLSAARNTGIENAKGKYVYFLDSDDYLVETALEELYQKAETDNLDVLKFSAYVFWNHSKELIWTESNNDGYKYRGEYAGVFKGTEMLEQLILNQETHFCSCCLIFTKRDIVDCNHLRFCEGIIHEDNLFHWQLLSLSKRVGVLNKPLYCRRYREGSITQVPDWYNKMRSMCVIVNSCEQFLSNYPECEDEATIYYIKGFVENFIISWNKLPLKIRYGSEVKSYVQQIKKAAKKFGCGGKVWLFGFNIYLYSLYYWIVNGPYQTLKVRLKR